jgi:hypothetical protein
MHTLIVEVKAAECRGLAPAKQGPTFALACSPSLDVLCCAPSEKQLARCCGTILPGFSRLKLSGRQCEYSRFASNKLGQALALLLGCSCFQCLGCSTSPFPPPHFSRSCPSPIFLSRTGHDFQCRIPRRLFSLTCRSGAAAPLHASGGPFCLPSPILHSLLPRMMWLMWVRGLEGLLGSLQVSSKQCHLVRSTSSTQTSLSSYSL